MKRILGLFLVGLVALLTSAGRAFSGEATFPEDSLFVINFTKGEPANGEEWGVFRNPKDKESEQFVAAQVKAEEGAASSFSHATEIKYLLAAKGKYNGLWVKTRPEIADWRQYKSLVLMHKVDAMFTRRFKVEIKAKRNGKPVTFPCYVDLGDAPVSEFTPLVLPFEKFKIEEFDIRTKERQVIHPDWSEITEVTLVFESDVIKEKRRESGTMNLAYIAVCKGIEPKFSAKTGATK